MAYTHQVSTTRTQRKKLETLVARPSAPAGVVRRARVILLSAAGVDGVEIAARLDLSPEAVSRIRRRFVEAGVDGLHDRPKAGRHDHAVPADTVEQIVQLALSPANHVPAGRYSAAFEIRIRAGRILPPPRKIPHPVWSFPACGLPCPSIESTKCACLRGTGVARIASKRHAMTAAKSATTPVM